MKNKRLLTALTIILLAGALLISNKVLHRELPSVAVEIGPPAEAMAEYAVAIGKNTNASEDHGLHIIMPHPTKPGAELEIRGKTVWIAIREVPMPEDVFAIDYETEGFLGWEHYDENKE